LVTAKSRRARLCGPSSGPRSIGAVEGSKVRRLDNNVSKTVENTIRAPKKCLTHSSKSPSVSETPLNAETSNFTPKGLLSTTPATARPDLRNGVEEILGTRRLAKVQRASSERLRVYAALSACIRHLQKSTRLSVCPNGYLAQPRGRLRNCDRTHAILLQDE